MPLQCLSPSPNVLLRSSYANSNRQCHVTLDRRPGAGARVCCVDGAKPKSKVDVAKLEREAEELVTMLMSKFTDKEPLVNTLSKYVRIVRIDHCFRLFEELGKTDKWIQCLETCHTSDRLDKKSQHFNRLSLIGDIEAFFKAISFMSCSI